MKLLENKILGIDPGTNILGYGLLNIQGNEMKIETMGVFNLTKLPDHTSKLKEIFLQMQELIEAYLPATMAIEAPFFGKNVQSMLKLGRAQGVAMAAGMTMGLEIFDYSPKSIKKSITGNGNASKEQVSAMLGQLLRVKFVDEYLDATDALAVAMCHHNNNGRKLVGGKKYTGWGAFIKENENRIKK